MVLLSQTGEKVPVPPVSPGLPHHPGRVGPAALPGVSVPDEPLPQVACTSSCQQICPPAFTASRASRRPADCGSGRAPSSAAEANPRLPTNEPCIGCRLESARLAPGEGEGGGVFHPSATVRDCIGDLPMVLDAQVLTIDCHDEALRQAKFKLDLLPRIQLLSCNFQQRSPLLHSRWLDRPWQRICLP